MRYLVLGLLAACGRVAFEPLADAGVTCPSTYVVQSTGCYRFVIQPQELPWRDAELACEADGGHLVVVDNDDERGVLDLLTPSTISDFWIGASARVTANVYVTVTRRPLFVTWAADEPDLTGICMELTNAFMGDSNCDVINDYVCEIDGIAADPSTY